MNNSRKYGKILTESSTKKDEILSLAAMWMELEDIIISEINQARKINITLSQIREGRELIMYKESIE
jgi:hypothetical protein